MVTAPSAEKHKPAVQQSGDALDDDFALDEQFAPFASDNDDKDDGAKPAKPVDPLEEDDFAPASDQESEEQPARKKRKASSDTVPIKQCKNGTASTDDAKKDKRKQKKEQKRAKLAELGLGEAEQLGLMPPEILADRLAEKQRKALPKLSTMEMDDVRIPRERRLLRGRSAGY